MVATRNKKSTDSEPKASREPQPSGPEELAFNKDPVKKLS
jgi:hypothetical protein